MTRPAGTKNKKQPVKTITKAKITGVPITGNGLEPDFIHGESPNPVDGEVVDKIFGLPVVTIDYNKPTREILLSIVDALYEKDHDSVTWGEIRKKIEAL